MLPGRHGSACLAGVLALLAATAATRAHAAIEFDRTDLPAAANPYDAEVADVDGDGRLDLVVANASTPGTVSVFRGQADGSFAERVNHPVGAGPRFVGVGDVDGDGRADLVTAGDDDLVTVLRGQAGGFAPPVTHDVLPDSPYGRTGLDLADVNVDGRADLVTVGDHAAPPSIRVLLGTTAAGFADAAVRAIPGTKPASHIVVTDVHGDGLPDVAVGVTDPEGETWSQDGALLMRGGGSAMTFTFEMIAGSNAGGTSRLISALDAIPDVSGDGRRDVAIALRHWRTTGDERGPIFVPALGTGVTPFQPLGYVNGIGGADFDGDGRNDIVATFDVWRTSYGSGLALYRQVDGFPFCNSPRGCSGRTLYPSVGAGARSVVAADLEADGRPDIVTANVTAGTISVLRNVPLQNLTPPSIPAVTTPGRTINCQPGTWRAADAVAYRWVRNGVEVGTGKSYAYSAADVGRDLRCEVTGTNVRGESVAARSNGVSGSITGTVLNAKTGAPIVIGACITAKGPVERTVTARGDGTYAIADLPSGVYAVRFTDCDQGRFRPEWFNDRLAEADASPVSVGAGGVRAGVNAKLDPVGTISGTVTAKATGAPLGDICVSAQTTPTSAPVGSTTTAADGTWAIGGLVSGRYRLRFTDCGGGGYREQYYNGKPDAASANTVALDAPGKRAGVVTKLVR